MNISHYQEDPVINHNNQNSITMNNETIDQHQHQYHHLELLLENAMKDLEAFKDKTFKEFIMLRKEQDEEMLDFKEETRYKI